jgi:ion channel
MQLPTDLKTVLTLVGLTLWLMAAHSIGVWIWAATFLRLGAFDALEPAVNFSIISFTTLGFGDVVLMEKWRVLSGLTAANGLLIFALSAAFLVEFLTRVRQAQSIILQRSNN